MFCPALAAEVPLWLKVVLSARPPSGTAKSEETKQNPLSHSSLDCPAALPHTEIGKVTLMREIPTVNHWLPGLFTHSLKGSPFKFDQYQPKSSRRVSQEWLLGEHRASGKIGYFKWAVYAEEWDEGGGLSTPPFKLHQTDFWNEDTHLILHLSRCRLPGRAQQSGL